MRRCPPAPSASSTSPAHPSSQCWPQKSYLGTPRGPLAQRPLRSCKRGRSRRPTRTYPYSCRPFLCSRLNFVPPNKGVRYFSLSLRPPLSFSSHCSRPSFFTRCFFASFVHLVSPLSLTLASPAVFFVLLPFHFSSFPSRSGWPFHRSLP